MNDARAGIKLLKSLKGRIKKIFGDRACDSKAIFNIFGSKTAIPQRSNASTVSRGSPAREKVVRDIRKTSEKE